MPLVGKIRRRERERGGWGRGEGECVHLALCSPPSIFAHQFPRPRSRLEESRTLWPNSSLSIRLEVQYYLITLDNTVIVPVLRYLSRYPAPRS